MANVIKIKTDIDTSGATAQLTSLENRIVKTADRVEKLKDRMSKMETGTINTEQYQRLEKELEKTDGKAQKLWEDLKRATASGAKPTRIEKIQQAIDEASEKARMLNDYLVELNEEGNGQMTLAEANPEAYSKVKDDIKYAENELKQLNIKHDELIAKQNAAAANGKKAYGSLGGSLEKVTKRIGKLMLRVFIFSQITKAFRAMVTGMKEGFQNLAQYSNQYNKNMSELASVNATLKNNLAAAFEPIMNMIIPALSSLVSWLNTAVTAIGKFFAALGGSKVYTKATKQTINYADSLKKAGSAQKGVLAGFDDLNVLNQNKGGGAGGGEATGADAFEEGTMTDEFYERVQKIKEILEAILPIVLLIGAALLAWKVFSFLESLMAISPILATILGIVLLIVGIALAVWNYFRMWKDGVDWKGIIGFIAGVAIAAGALMFLFGPLVAGIFLIIASIAGLVLAIKDIIENGVNAQNMTLLIISILGILLGVLIAFGAPVAAVVAGIMLYVGALIALCAYGGNAQEALGHLKKAFKALGDFISKIFTGDIEGAFESLKEMGKELLNFYLSFYEGLVKGAVKAVNAIIDAINSVGFGPVPDWVPVIGGKEFFLNIPKFSEDISFPRLANGGVTTGSTLAQIGEAGREAVLPLENNTGWMDDLASKLADKMPTYSNTGTAVLEIDGKTAGRIFYPLIQNESSRIGTSMVTS